MNEKRGGKYTVNIGRKPLEGTIFRLQSPDMKYLPLKTSAGALLSNRTIEYLDPDSYLYFILLCPFEDFKVEKF